MPDFSFSKQERLKSRKIIEGLFASGRSVYVYPVKLLFQCHASDPEENSIVQLGVSVSSKKFKRAVDRNLLKRRIREAYRLNKKNLIELAREKNLHLSVFVLYLGKNKESYPVIQKAMVSAMAILGRMLDCEDRVE